MLAGLRDSGCASGRDEVGLFAAFDGVGGARRAFELLNVELALYATSEIDVSANRVVERAWPDVRALGSIRDIDEKVLLDIRGGAPELKVLFFVAGFPCQNVSGLNAKAVGAGGKETILILEAERVYRLLVQVFKGVRVLRLYENVKSMGIHGPESRRQLSAVIGSRPFSIEFSDMSETRRPRYYWID